MKRNMIVLLILLITLLLNKSVIGQNLNYATASISINIIVPLIAQENSQLAFGRFYPGNGGKIIISPNGSVTATDNVVIDNASQSPGSFVIAGEINSEVNVSLPNQPIIITNENSNSMTVDGWNSDKNIKLDDGNQTISIGATLNVGSLDQNPKGTYVGTYQITFSYN